MSGSYRDARYPPDVVIGMSERGYIQLTTGTTINHAYERIDVDYESIWEKMYVKPKPVIIVCAACRSHNAVTNSVCVQCGYPMGYGEQRIFE